MSYYHSYDPYCYTPPWPPAPPCPICPAHPVPPFPLLRPPFPMPHAAPCCHDTSGASPVCATFSGRLRGHIMVNRALAPLPLQNVSHPYNFCLGHKGYELEVKASGYYLIDWCGEIEKCASCCNLELGMVISHCCMSPSDDVSLDTINPSAQKTFSGQRLMQLKAGDKIIFFADTRKGNASCTTKLKKFGVNIRRTDVHDYCDPHNTGNQCDACRSYQDYSDRCHRC